MNPTLLIYTGGLGICIGVVLLGVFLVRRWPRRKNLSPEQRLRRPGLMRSIIHLLGILLWTTFWGMILSIGFFLQAYQAFTLEKPVAEVQVLPTDQPQTFRLELTQFLADNRQITNVFLIRGDQWMLEGDILKWDDWLTLLGFQSRYRFTRIRGRYLRTEDEINRPATIYTLVQNENHPVWRYLYDFGSRLPFVSTVYGTAVYQNSEEQRRFRILVSPSGFVVREVLAENRTQTP
ncbi:MAG: hypothetical protein D6681_09610 [Calditrichaeota bacterium]|nr:MAG: hypothetical protein D6681_09610 [Calditrichota bacterium]